MNISDYLKGLNPKLTELLPKNGAETLAKELSLHTETVRSILTGNRSDYNSSTIKMVVNAALNLIKSEANAKNELILKIESNFRRIAVS